jgi:hypothetical protein
VVGKVFGSKDRFPNDSTISLPPISGQTIPVGSSQTTFFSANTLSRSGRRRNSGNDAIAAVDFKIFYTDASTASVP